jgi:long-chain acyl-CoA synthetase
VIVLQGYGATETGTGACTILDDHGLGTVGRPPSGIEMRIAEDGEVQFRGRPLFKGYWNDPAATAAAYTEDGWYRSGDIGHLDEAGRLILSGRSRDMIVLPNGFNVYPEDIENALRVAGLREAVVVRRGLVGSRRSSGETGGVCGIAAPPAGSDHPIGRDPTRIDATVKTANAA